MENPVINQQVRESNPFQRDERARLDKNKFDLSHDVKTTFKMGRLVPFLLLETLPGDDFIISTEALYRFAPLYLPLMHRVEVKTHYFYVPNRIVWPNWTKFISGDETINMAQTLWAISSQSNQGGIMEYFGAPSFDESSVSITNINALPYAAYIAIYNEYYRNPNLEEEVIFYSTGTPMLEDGVQNPTGAQYNGALHQPWYEPFYAHYNFDYFTAARPTPQMGQDVLIPLVDQNSQGFTEIVNANGNPTSTGALDVIAGSTLGRTAIASQFWLDPMPDAGTISQFRLASQLQEWLEKVNRTTNRYRDFMKGFFGTDPSPLQVDVPVYLGGSKGVVKVGEVMATAQTETTSIETPLGAYAGQALFAEQTKTIRYECSEHGHILGIIQIIPKTSYGQGLEKNWLRTTWIDYAWPQFAEIGDQEILNYEIFLSGKPENEDEFGYVPRYSEYRYKNDIISGQMRDTFMNFHLARWFEDTPLLNYSFVQAQDIRRQDVFVLPDANEHEVYAHMFNNVKVWRGLPRFGIPQL